MSEKPCETCAAQGLYAYSTLWTLEDCQRNCPLYFRWEGHQEGYAAGQKDLARECWDWWSGERDCFNDDQFIRFEKWLRERGVM